MRSFLKIAWRNLWRNKRRTFITMASVFVAVFLSLATRSMQIGSYDNMIKNAVRLSTGYIQIHDNGYWEDKSINNTFETSLSLYNSVNSNENITLTLPRLESFALGSSGVYTKGVFVIGTDPEIEDSLTNLSDKLVEGEYFNDEEGVIVGKGLADYLHVGIDDTLILIGQGYHGVTAAGKYRITGIFKFPVPQMDNQMVYMRLKDCQYLYNSENRLTSYTIMIDDGDDLNVTVAELKELTGEEYEVLSWEVMNKEMVQMIKSDNAGGIFMLGVLYMIVGFGVFGTMMMMTMERRKEFAVMIAVGMQKTRLSIIVFFETLFIGFLGVVVGVIISFPLLLYLFYNPIPITGEMAESFEIFGVEPIVPFSVEPSIFINQSLIVMLICFIAVMYPIIAINRFNILKAMRS